MSNCKHGNNFLSKLKRKGYFYLILIAPTISLVWFFVRVVPKPSRIAYPCQQSAIAVVLGAFSATFRSLVSLAYWVLDKIKSIFINNFSFGNVFKKGIIAALFLVAIWGLMDSNKIYYRIRYSLKTSSYFDSVYNQKIKIHTENLKTSNNNVAIAAINQRVVRVASSAATDWDFSAGYYWQYINQNAVDRMVEEGVKSLTGAIDVVSAWQIIMANYSPGQTVGIKVNGNDFWNNDQSEIDATPQLINSVIKGLKSIGIPENNIRIIEGSLRDRYFYPYYYDIVNGLYPAVYFYDHDDTTFNIGGDARVDFPYAASQNITDLIVNTDHLILMPIMKAISRNWGLSGAIKLMMGVVPSPLNLHNYIDDQNANNAAVLIYQNRHIKDKTRLIIGDGLFGMWTGIHFSGAGEIPSDTPHPWVTFSNGAPNNLFFSYNPVAIDSVMASYIDAERSSRSLPQLTHSTDIAAQLAGLGPYEKPPFSTIDYVDINLDSGPVEIIGLVRQNCSGYNNCFTSLAQWENNYGGVNFGTCPVGDLVCANVIAKAQIEENWTLPDTGPVIINGWNTDSSRYIKIVTAPSARHDGKWNYSKYRLQTTSGDPIIISEENVRIEGLQIYRNRDAGGAAIYLNGNSAGMGYDVRISQNIIRGRVNLTKANQGGIVIYNSGSGIARIWNNVVYNFSGSSYPVYNFRINDAQFNVYLYNNTSQNSRYCFYSNAGATVAKNNIAQDCFDGYYGNFSPLSSNNLSNIANDAPGSSPINSTAVSFVNKGTKNFHLAAGDTGAMNRGIGLFADADNPFFDDIDSQMRADPWDIGADEYVSVVDSGVGGRNNDEILASSLALNKDKYSIMYKFKQIINVLEIFLSGLFKWV